MDLPLLDEPKDLSLPEDLGLSQIWGYLSGVPIIRIIVFWGLYWGSLMLGNYHLGYMDIWTEIQGLRIEIWSLGIEIAI